MITVLSGLQRKSQNDQSANGHTGHYRADKLSKQARGLFMLRLVRDIGDDLLGLGLFHTVILQGLRVTVCRGRAPPGFLCDEVGVNSHAPLCGDTAQRFGAFVGAGCADQSAHAAGNHADVGTGCAVHLKTGDFAGFLLIHSLPFSGYGLRTDRYYTHWVLCVNTPTKYFLGAYPNPLG